MAAQILLFDTTFGSKVQVLSLYNGFTQEKCEILGIKGNCVTTGSMFSQHKFSFAFIHLANELGHILTTKEGIEKAISDKARIIESYKTLQTKSIDANLKQKENIKNIIVTTGDLKESYDVIGPVYFQVSNKGLFTTELSKLIKQNADELALIRNSGQMGTSRNDWGFLYGEFSVGQKDFDKAFFVGVQELKKRAFMLGADAIIAMRQDIDLDTTNIQHFYMQMYGTAVRFREANQIENTEG